MTVSTSRKKLSRKVTVSIREKNLSAIAGMKDSFKNTLFVQLDRKRNFSRQEFLKKFKKWFLLARKSVSITRNEVFVEKYVITLQKFFWQGNQRKLFPLTGKSFKIGSP